MGIKSYTGIGVYPKKKKNHTGIVGLNVQYFYTLAFSHVCILLYHGKVAVVSHSHANAT